MPFPSIQGKVKRKTIGSPGLDTAAGESFAPGISTALAALVIDAFNDRSNK
jgi:hypothetical protein